LSTNY